MNIEIILCKK